MSRAYFCVHFPPSFIFPQPIDQPGLENEENVHPELPDIGPERMPPGKRPRSGESGSRQSPPQTQSADFVGFATQRPSSSGVYQALAEAAEESFSEPSYVVVNETVKQFAVTGGVLAETKTTQTN